MGARLWYRSCPAVSQISNFIVVSSRHTVCVRNAATEQRKRKSERQRGRERERERQRERESERERDREKERERERQREREREREQHSCAQRHMHLLACNNSNRWGVLMACLQHMEIGRASCSERV